MKTVAIIQARMNSTRFPGKIMEKVCGRTILEWMIFRVKQANIVDKIIVATTHNSGEIVDLCLKKDWDYFAGPEDDVLQRVTSAANLSGATYVVDLTSDCPLVDPAHISFLCGKVRLGGFEYACNIFPRLWADGFDVQVYTARLLRKINERITDPKMRTHTGYNYLSGLFASAIVYNLPPKKRKHYMPKVRLTLDYPEDLVVIESIIKYFYIDKKRDYYSAEEIQDFILDHPELLVNKDCETKEPGE